MLGVDYVALYQNVSSPVGEIDEAASGIARIYGKWTFVDRGGKNPGSLVWLVEHRHKLGTDITPSELGFATGYYGLTYPQFNDVEFVLNDFYWAQTINEGAAGIVIGRYDPNDFFNASGYANPWTAFQNVTIQLDTSVALPDTSAGIGAGALPRTASRNAPTQAAWPLSCERVRTPPETPWPRLRRKLSQLRIRPPANTSTRSFGNSL